MRGEQLVDFAREPHARRHQHDEVVGDALEVGHEVRRDHDAEPVLGHDLHQALQELAAGERIEAGDRLVEDQQLGALGHGQGQRELRPLSAGKPPGLLRGRQSEPLDALPGEVCVPTGIEPSAEPEVIGDRQRRVGRRVLRDEADAGELCAPAAGRPPSTSIVPAVGASSPTARCRRVVLPAPFGPTSPTTRPAGISSVQSVSAQRRR